VLWPLAMAKRTRPTTPINSSCRSFPSNDLNFLSSPIAKMASEDHSLAISNERDSRSYTDNPYTRRRLSPSTLRRRWVSAIFPPNSSNSSI
jgi:hypothetical protein